ncbi:hypothetical protein BJV77DRAFT_698764 [Russula vinacea]|nr:hypothetical protein BJV77DRAFT_698764 [Russula vinacea]
MAYNIPRKGCFKCGNLGHIAENCTSQERLCYNCRKPGHESSACTEPRTVAAKQCYSCGGIGHIQAECPTLRLQGSNQKCYNCGILGILRACVRMRRRRGRAGLWFASRAPPPGRGLNMASLPPIKCYRCGGPNHMARDCLAPPYSVTEDMNGHKEPEETCYKCKAPGHLYRSLGIALRDASRLWKRRTIRGARSRIRMILGVVVERMRRPM